MHIIVPFGSIVLPLGVVTLITYWIVLFVSDIFDMLFCLYNGCAKWESLVTLCR